MTLRAAEPRAGAFVVAAALAFLIAVGSPVCAQTASNNDSQNSNSKNGDSQSSGIDESALFGVQQPIEQATPGGAPAPAGTDSTGTGSAPAGTGVPPGDSTAQTGGLNPADTLLRTSGVEWGGMLTSTMTASWGWTGGDTIPEITTFLPTSSLDTKLEASLYFDSRPSTDFRVFGKLKFDYPFSVPAGTGGLTIPDISVFELFSDFAIGDRVFFRAGKQTVKWGVGYFFSPADVLSLEPINPEEPTQEREGPLSVKAELPFGLNTLTAYVVDNNVLKPDELAVAAKVDFVVGGWELSVGGFYQRDLVPRAVLMATGSIWRFNLFAEAVGSYGADRVFLESIPVDAQYPYGIRTYRIQDRLFAEATAGFSLSFPVQNLTFTAQYFYNGTGYVSAGSGGSATLLETAMGALGAAAAGGPSPGFTGADLVSFGRHYAAATAAVSKIGTDDLGASIFWLGNMSDFSGTVKPGLSYALNRYFGLNAGLTITYGKIGGELSPMGMVFSTYLGASLGTGAF